MIENRSTRFFDEQFRCQQKDVALKLNPFEELALPYLNGDVLDYGCGMGNLAFAAAGRDCKVTAFDASPAAIEHIRARAANEGASVSASIADLRHHQITRKYDCVVSIGLLMYFDCATARTVLSEMQSHVRPGGVAVINVLVKGTTYLEMFDPSDYCLFDRSAMQHCFRGWHIEHLEFADFEAPLSTMKCFCTIVARKPDAHLGGDANLGV